MKRYIPAILMGLALLGASTAQALVIDDFTDINPDDEYCDVLFLNGVQCASVHGLVVQDSNVDIGLAGVLGGTRDLLITAPAPQPGFATVSVGLGTMDLLDFSNQPMVASVTTIVWDGDSITNNTIADGADPSLLGIGKSLGAGIGIDLTDGGSQNAWEFNINALDLPVMLEIIVRDASGQIAIDTFMKKPCRSTLSDPECAGNPDVSAPVFPYGFHHAFSLLQVANSNIDLTQVTAVALRLFNPNGEPIDLQLLGIETVGDCEISCEDGNMCIV